MRERNVEDTLCRRVRKLGGWPIKAEGLHTGFPDRMLLLPGGRVRFVETKAPWGELRADQVRVIEALRLAGFAVDVVWSMDELDKYMEGL